MEGFPTSWLIFHLVEGLLSLGMGESCEFYECNDVDVTIRARYGNGRRSCESRHVPFICNYTALTHMHDTCGILEEIHVDIFLSICFVKEKKKKKMFRRLRDK